LKYEGITAYLGLFWHGLLSFTAAQLSSKWNIVTEFGESKSSFLMFDRTLGYDCVGFVPKASYMKVSKY
jgi:hypothetical protein